MLTKADKIYQKLLTQVAAEGDIVDTRNSLTTSNINLPNTKFTEFPLVTLKKTAIKKAISEMEWFLSGSVKCPEHLRDWWNGQLDPEGRLLDGYATQFRRSTEYCDQYVAKLFDQVKFLLDGLKNSPNSRRLLISMWNPGEMAKITQTNKNPNTPTCCHSIVVQFFVRKGKLHMKSYQRSADMLLGVPHNWVQSWAMLLYFAYHSGLEVGSMTWMWGDAHIYKEESHEKAVQQMLNVDVWVEECEVELLYNPKLIEHDSQGVPKFKMEDFELIAKDGIPAPVVTNKIKML